jgi:hypothetical protein
MRLATYALVCLSSIVWGLPVAIYAGLMFTLHGRGNSIANTLQVAWPFSGPVLLPAVGALGSITVPPLLRAWKYDRFALACASVALVVGLLVVVLPNAGNPNSDAHQNKLGHSRAN